MKLICLTKTQTKDFFKESRADADYEGFVIYENSDKKIANY